MSPTYKGNEDKKPIISQQLGLISQRSRKDVGHHGYPENSQVQTAIDAYRGY